jgi:hypothetical protein
MGIDMMTTREKTTLLAWLIGWRVRRYGTSVNPRYGRYGLYDASDKFIRRADVPNGIEVNPLDHIVPDLYDEQNMALAWRVWKSAATQKAEVVAPMGAGQVLWQVSWADILIDVISPNGELFSLAPAEAQATWLDAILEMAVGAGMI